MILQTHHTCRHVGMSIRAGKYFRRSIGIVRAGWCILAGMKELTVSEMASLGGKARAEKLSAEELSDQGRKAVQARWAKAGKAPSKKKKVKQ